MLALFFTRNIAFYVCCLSKIDMLLWSLTCKKRCLISGGAATYVWRRIGMRQVWFTVNFFSIEWFIDFVQSIKFDKKCLSLHRSYTLHLVFDCTVLWRGNFCPNLTHIWVDTFSFDCIVWTNQITVSKEHVKEPSFYFTGFHINAFKNILRLG